LAKEREKRQLFVHFVLFIAVLVVVCVVVGAVNEHFHGVPVEAISPALGAGIGAFIGALFYLWCLISVGLKLGLLKEGKATPLIMQS
jgi:Ca2+/H+ antiporter